MTSLFALLLNSPGLEEELLWWLALVAGFVTFATLLKTAFPVRRRPGASLSATPAAKPPVSPGLIPDNPA